jgi:hypothetical protein
MNESMFTKPRTDQKSVIPDWLVELRSRSVDRYFTESGHAWIRFHKFAFMRFPPHDISNVQRTEEREVFFKAKALLISSHHLPKPDQSANAFLYLCNDKEYDISKLSSNNRSKVRRGSKRLRVRRTSPTEIAEKSYACYRDTCVRNGLAPISEQVYQNKWLKDANPAAREIWAAFAGEEVAALGIVWICGKWAELFSTQSANRYLKDYSNHILFYDILRDLLHRDNIESVSYGLSSAQPNSKADSLHHFKLSVNFEAIPVVRDIKVNPFLRPVINKTTLQCARLLEHIFPNTRHLLAARGALEIIVDGL